MAISSDTLFHFTNHPNGLLGILKNGFLPSYCLETLKYNGKVKSRSYPMVCFCDIPLSQIKQHLDFYGSYGLGMTKEWGRQNKLNPILYLDSDSKLNQYLIDMANEIWSDRCKENCAEQTIPLRSSYWHMMRYIKAYSGDFERGAKTYKDYKYYNEREWRFVPEVLDTSQDSNELYYLTEEEHKDDFKRADQNQAIQNVCKLTFEPKDIEYVIVKEKKQIFSMIDTIKRMGRDRMYSDKDLDYLMTKILTVDQIKNDF